MAFCNPWTLRSQRLVFNMFSWVRVKQTICRKCFHVKVQLFFSDTTENQIFRGRLDPLLCQYDTNVPNKINSRIPFLKGIYLRGLLKNLQMKKKYKKVISKNVFMKFPRTHILALNDQY